MTLAAAGLMLAAVLTASASLAAPALAEAPQAASDTFRVFLPLLRGGGQGPTVPTPIPPTPTPPTPTPPTPTPPADPPWNEFLGVNGGPLDGANSPNNYDGNLSHDASLRGKSFQWMTEAGINWYRNYGSDNIVYSWNWVEPARGQFDWSKWDLLAREAQKKNIALLASIGNGVPRWANNSANWRDKPLDLYSEPMQNTSWYQYVRAMVERYDGDGTGDMPGLTLPIKHWGVWNEPDLRTAWNPPNYPPHQFNGSVQDYVQLMRVAYSAIKDADPTAVVVGPSTAQYPGRNYTGEWHLWTWDEMIAAGGLNYMDVLSFHTFLELDTWDIGNNINAILESVDVRRAGKPVWLTEVGWDGASDVHALEKARNLVRLTVILWEQQFVEKFFWYTFQASETYAGHYHKAFIQTLNGSDARGTEPDALFHPIYRAAEVMTTVLGNFETDDHPTALYTTASPVRAYKFSRDGEEVWVIWHRAATGSTSINLDTGGRTTRMIGLYGEDLGTFSGGQITARPTPIYLTTKLDWNENVGRVAGRLRDAARPNQWNNAAAGITVSLTGPVNATTVSDSTGNYSFENLPAGTYQVRVVGRPATPGSISVVVARHLPWGRTSFRVTLP